jgi:hypothetical protein
VENKYIKSFAVIKIAADTVNPQNIPKPVLGENDKNTAAIVNQQRPTSPTS